MNAHDVLDIPQADMPLLVFSDNLYSFFSWRIRCETKGFTHAMWLYAPRTVATQGWTFKAEDVAKFLSTSRMEFWHNPSWTHWDAKIVTAALVQKMERPLFYRVYDFLGIIGHLVKKRTFDSPFQEYCSEQAARVLREVEPEMEMEHPTPKELREWCIDSKQMTLYGRYHPYETI